MVHKGLPFHKAMVHKFLFYVVLFLFYVLLLSELMCSKGAVMAWKIIIMLQGNMLHSQLEMIRCLVPLDFVAVKCMLRLIVIPPI